MGTLGIIGATAPLTDVYKGITLTVVADVSRVGALTRRILGSIPSALSGSVR